METIKYEKQKIVSAIIKTEKEIASKPNFRYYKVSDFNTLIKKDINYLSDKLFTVSYLNNKIK